jgi:hypothetical protein
MREEDHAQRCSCLNVVSRAGERQQGLFNDLERGDEILLFPPHATVALACSSITQLYPDNHPADLASGSLSYQHVEDY